MYLILSILIAMGESRQFPKLESEKRTFHYLGLISVNRKMKYQLQFQEVPM